jgi:3-dehydroquinate dehydratase I
VNAGKTVKGGGEPPRLVGVITSRAELQRAVRLRRAPDLFELRLDALWPAIDKLENTIAKLRAPLIITARHPQEGGRHSLTARQRRDVLQRFSSCASWIDVELRSLSALQHITGSRRIVSAHLLTRTPPVVQLLSLSTRAFAAGADIFKIATRTDTPAEVQRLLDFFDQAHTAQQPISAMGIGKLGAAARRLLARRGSALNYAHLGTAAAEGQLSLAELRRVMRR